MAEKHDLSDPQNFVDYLKNSVRPSKASGVVVEVFLVTTDPESFVREQLENLRESGCGIFSRLKHRKGDSLEPYFEYQCERHNKPRGRSSGVSTETRANRCTAFVSFKFATDGEYKGCIRRLRSRHNGHDPSSLEEKCVGMIDRSVVRVIETLASNGKRAKDILQAVKVWSSEKGYKNTSDRRYYPKAQDIHNILKAYRKHLIFHKDDFLCVNHLLQGDLYHSCLSCCLPGIQDSDSSMLDSVRHDQHQQFYIVLQTPEQAEYLRSHGSGCSVAFFSTCSREDATAVGDRNSQFLVCVLGIPSKGDYSVPVAVFIVEGTTGSGLESALGVFKDSFPDFCPSAFIVDQEECLSHSLQLIWPEAVLLWSWYNALQNLTEDLASNFKSGLSGPKNAENRQALITCMWQLKNCWKESQFEKMSANLPAIGKKGQAYLQTHWLPSAKQWSDFGRTCIFDDGTSRLAKLAEIDRMFVKQKLLFGACQLSQKLDCVVLMLTQTSQYFFTTMTSADLSLSRTESPSSSLYSGATVRVKTEKGVTGEREEEGALSRAVWLEEGVCVVPSEENVLLSWRVDFVAGVCSCPASVIEGSCRHLQADTTAVFRHQNISLEALQEKGVDEIIKRRSFHQVGNTFLVVHTGRFLFSLVLLKDSVLRCAFTHTRNGSACVCKRVVAALCPNKTLTFAERSGDPSWAWGVEGRQILKQESHDDNEDDPLANVILDCDGAVNIENECHGIRERVIEEHVIEEIILTTEHHQADMPGEIMAVDLTPGNISELLLSLSATGNRLIVSETAVAVAPKEVPAAAATSGSASEVTIPAPSPPSVKTLTSGSKESASLTTVPVVSSVVVSSSGTNLVEVSSHKAHTDMSSAQSNPSHTLPNQSQQVKAELGKEHSELVSLDSAVLKNTGFETSAHDSIAVPGKKSETVLSTKQMIQDLARWAESEQFEDGSELKGIISQAHSFIFPASKEDSLPTCLHLCADQTPSQSCSDILSMSADSPSTVGTEGHQTMSLPPNERSGDPSCVEHLKSSPLLLTANVSLKPCTGSLPCEQGDALITDCKVVQSSSAKCHPTASSEKNVIQHLPSDMLQQQVTSSPPPAGATQASKRGLDDLVRRLELRQLGEENGSSCLPSPAKKPHIGDTELADSSDVAYFVPATAQDGASGEIIYIMAV